MPLTYDQFKGIAPRISAKKLPAGLAQVAENCYTRGGQLRAMRGITDVKNVLEGTQSIFYDQIVEDWVTSVDERDYVRPFLEGDTQRYTYFTDGTKPKFYVAGNAAETYNLAIPRPATPTVSLTSQGTGEESSAVDVSYIVAWVDGFGRLGPTSDVSTIIQSVVEGFTVTVTRPALPIAENWNATGAFWRIYRANTGTSGTEFQFIAEVPLATGSYADSAEPDQLLEVAESELWVGAPDGSVGLIQNGRSLFCYKDNEVYGSEPAIPHAFPYSWAFQENVRGLVSISAGILVCTDGAPFVIAGSEPANMQKVPLESRDPCLSSASVVDMGASAIYASLDGLIGVTGLNVKNLTSELFSKDDWAAFNPSTIRAFRYEDYYVGFYGDLDEATGFIFDASTSDFKTIQGLEVSRAAVNPDDGTVGVLYESGTDLRLGTFDTGTPLTFTWESGIETKANFGGYRTVRVEADGYPVVVTVKGDNESDTLTIVDDEPHFLPAPYVAKNWSMSVTGEYNIDFVGVFESMGGVV